MAPDRYIDGLMDKLLKAVECSLAASEAARETVEAILRKRADTSVFFSGAAVPEASPIEAAALTPEDREFLRTLGIRPDSA